MFPPREGNVFTVYWIARIGRPAIRCAFHNHSTNTYVVERDGFWRLATPSVGRAILITFLAFCAPVFTSSSRPNHQTELRIGGAGALFMASVLGTLIVGVPTVILGFLRGLARSRGMYRTFMDVLEATSPDLTSKVTRYESQQGLSAFKSWLVSGSVAIPIAAAVNIGTYQYDRAVMDAWEAKQKVKASRSTDHSANKGSRSPVEAALRDDFIIRQASTAGLPTASSPPSRKLSARRSGRRAKDTPSTLPARCPEAKSRRRCFFAVYNRARSLQFTFRRSSINFFSDSNSKHLGARSHRVSCAGSETQAIWDDVRVQRE